MTHQLTYRIVETPDPRRPGERLFEVWGDNLATGYERLFEVWGDNLATGYEWLIAVYDTREQAREMIRHWQEAKT